MKHNDAQNNVTMEQAAQELFDFAVERQDIKWLMAQLPDEAAANRSTMEYELQLLKIISVGWCISYADEPDADKEQLLAGFWQAVYEFSKSLSVTTGLMIGQDIDYFQTLKDRLDRYVGIMAEQQSVVDPAQIIGPEFANACGSPDDLGVVLTGSKMFTAVVTNVTRYLRSLSR